MVHVIDDDEAVRESLEALLLVSGFDVEIYSSAEEFLAREPDPQGCLLLDVNMPGMSGLDLLQQLVEQRRRTPVIFLTASRDERQRERAAELGARGFLNKPVTEDTLLRAIAEAQEHTGNAVP